jgi:hypothetical protein
MFTREPRRQPAVRLRCETLEARTVPSFLPPVQSPGKFTDVGDFNGDRRADLVVADQKADTVAIRLGNGDGTFQPAGPVQVVPFLYGPKVVADFNGDGNLDVLTNGNGLNLLRGNGDGTLQPPRRTIAPGDTTHILIADMNGDGRPDAIRRWVQDTPVSVHYWITILVSQADGTFTSTQKEDIGYAKKDHGYQYNPYPPKSVHVADFDGDSRQDLMTIASNGSNNAYPSRLLLGNGDGTVTIGPDVPQFVNVKVTVGDLNRDRKADVIRKNKNNSNWTVFLGEGNGEFTMIKNVSIASTPVIADINRDRKADLVAVDPANGNMGVLLGNGDGNFKPPQEFTTGVVATAFNVGDFDGDGWLDVIAAGGGTLSVLLNDRSW